MGIKKYSKLISGAMAIIVIALIAIMGNVVTVNATEIQNQGGTATWNKPEQNMNKIEDSESTV